MIDPASTPDPAIQRMLAGELAKSLWATAKPQGGDDADGSTSAADTFSTMFTDVLADAIAGVPTGPGSAKR